MFKSAKKIIRCLFTSKDKKIKFLQTKIYKYYFDCLIDRQTNGEINIPYFAIINQLKAEAIDRTSIDIANMIAEKRINECFRKALN